MVVASGGEDRDPDAGCHVKAAGQALGYGSRLSGERHVAAASLYREAAQGQVLPTSLSGDLAAALREHGSATFDEHYGHSHQSWPMPGLRSQHHCRPQLR